MRLSLLAGTLAAFAFAAPLAVADPAAAASFKSHKKYKVSGKATLVKAGSGHAVRLSGFRTTPGPDLYVYVGKGSPSRRIAKLRRFSGTQTYQLPKGVTPASFSTVHIHCKRFNSTFATAKLR